ncbi:MAG: hypothetical protein WC966_09050 [Bradymonadales bacterium]
MSKKLGVIFAMAFVLLSCSKDADNACRDCNESRVCCAGICCEADSICKDGVCTQLQCQAEELNCGGVCVDTSGSLLHCGACHRACNNDELCVDKSCVKQCALGEKLCDGECVKIAQNKEHCGDCGIVCEGDDICFNSNCVRNCVAPTKYCSGDCVETDTNVKHCGSCHRACKEGEKCESGECVVDCQDPLVDCDNRCVDLQSDHANCGACGSACKSDEVCSLSECSKNCATGLENCDNSCVDLQTNSSHCGSCNNTCAQSEKCVGGDCVCAEGYSPCGNDCVDLSTNSDHCGECNNKCEEEYACQFSQCILQCPEGQDNCAGTCYDTSKTTRHCGRCFNACKLAEFAAEMHCENSLCKIMNCEDSAKLCGDACVDTQNDARNCGDCNKQCQNHEICEEGKCQWTYSIWGTEYNDEIFDIAQDAEGNLYITGQTAGVFQGNIARGKSDAFLTKMTKSGIIVWTKQWGTIGDDFGKSVVVGKDGYIYVGGTTTDSFATIITTAGRSPFLTKFDADGNLLYTKQFGTMYDDDLVEIAAAPSEGVYMAGHTKGNIGGFILYGGSDIFVLKIAGNGNTAWKKQYGSSKDETLAAMSVYNEKLYLLGTTFGNMHDGVLPGSYLSPNFFITKAEDGGTSFNKTWTKEFGSLRPDTANALMLRTEDIEINNGGIKETKTMDVIYVTGHSPNQRGAHFDGHPTADNGVGVAMVKFSENGDRLSSMFLSENEKYYSSVALVEGYLKEMPTQALFGMTATEAAAPNTQGKALVWQLLDSGKILNSSAYVRLEQAKINASISIGDALYVVGRVPSSTKGQEAYIEKIRFSL